MNPAVPRIHWFLLGIATVLLVACTVAARIASSAALLPLTLSPGSSVTYTVVRLLPDTVRIALRFERKQGARRPELGEFVSRSGAGYLLFESPGEPVVIQVRGPSSAATFEALPAGSYGATHIGRNLVVGDTDDNPHRFQWPPNNASRPRLPIGISKVTLVVARVGDALSGEQVSAILEPPLSFKSASPRYGFLWWFYFWPVLAAPLVGYAAYLAWRVLRSRNRSASAA